MNKLIILPLTLALIVLISGCVQVPGDGTDESTDEGTTVADEDLASPSDSGTQLVPDERLCSNDRYSTAVYTKKIVNVFYRKYVIELNIAYLDVEEKEVIALTDETRNSLINALGRDNQALHRISDLTCITYLNLASAVKDLDISPLSNLTNLEYLSLYKLFYSIASKFPSSDFSFLSKLTKLKNLNLGATGIEDLSPLSNLTNLKVLDLSHNGGSLFIRLTDLSPLSNLSNLIYLDLTSNKLTDISALSSITSLGVLKLSSNNITDFSPLLNLTNLKELDLQNNNISDADCDTLRVDLPETVILC